MKRDVQPQSLSYIKFRAPIKGAPPCSPNRAPIDRDIPEPEPTFSEFSKFLVDGSLSSQRVLKGENCLIHLSKSPLNNPFQIPQRGP
jgi:hypothetical protein